MGAERSEAAKAQPNPHYTTPTMLSYPTTSTGLGNSRHGGAIFNLPREVRDEVYRLVVKGFYPIYVPHGKTWTAAIRTKESDFAILKVSKAISQEVLEVYLPESVFRFIIQLSQPATICLPSKLTNRMKNVEIVLNDTSLSHLNYRGLRSDHINTACRAGIAPFTGAHIARNSLRFLFSCCGPDMIDMLSVHLYETLKALTGFRTVIFEVEPSGCLAHEKRMGWITAEELSEVIDGIVQEMKNTLVPTLGPATERVLDGKGYLTFHPREQLVNTLE